MFWTVLFIKNNTNGIFDEYDKSYLMSYTTNLIKNAILVLKNVAQGNMLI